MMIECPKCHEMNGQNRDTCWKCQKGLRMEKGSRNCPYCGAQIQPGARVCAACRKELFYIREAVKREAVKKCPNCDKICSVNAVVCPDCGHRLSTSVVFREEPRPVDRPLQTDISRTDNPKWMYAVAVLLPLIGIILGCIYISKDERDFGQSLIKVSVIVFVVCAIIAGIAAGCAISEANRIMSSLQY